MILALCLMATATILAVACVIYLYMEEKTLDNMKEVPLLSFEAFEWLIDKGYGDKPKDQREALMQEAIEKFKIGKIDI